MKEENGRRPARISVAAPAKINLFLAVTAKRPDGYHELESLFCPLDLSDRLELDFETRGISLACDHPQAPADETNLAWRAAERFFKATGIPANLSIRLEKRIPVAAGLGGGSADAGAALAALNRHFGEPLSEGELRRIAAELGADVPFFLRAIPAWARGVGDRLRPIQNLPPRWVILLAFPWAVSTADVYKNLNLALTKCSKVTKSLTLTGGRFHGTGYALCNDLETVTAARHPEISAAKDALLSTGAEGALMSGSGPTVFGLFRRRETARKAEATLARREGWRVIATRLRV
ncbi:MAG: 4-(cytidine 5'-diphospho)-2-C-methyl-D-erythritol kinase [Desulfococcaceae bacterium]